MPWFQTTSEQIARNPIARAVAKKRLQASVIDACIKFYLAEPDSTLVDDVDATATVLATAQQILEGRGTKDQVIQGALSVCSDCAKKGFKWRPEYAVTLDVALQRALPIYMTASADEVQMAFKIIEGVRLQYA